jgi:FtsP/CotA-like multicopper oxidase with cupredoxin domain
MSLKQTNPAPVIKLNQGQELYLTLSNVGMVIRPDLFDTHSVHWHGFPNAAPIFDGVPESAPTPNMGGSFTYYYTAAVPGTFFYHCHVEAAEHMQMGMIGNLWVYPTQNELPDFTDLNGFEHRTGNTYAYNDDDGSTYYDVEYPIQLTGFDSAFHDASETVQPLPFADMFDDYAMINGRGYPDTINTALPADPDNVTEPDVIANVNDFFAQPDHTLITATRGEKILLRVSNVSTTHLYTIATTLGVPMKVVGRGAALLRGPTGLDTSYAVNVLNVAGGQAFDVIIDTATVPAGTYFLYTTNLANLSNGAAEDRGGIMTEIVIN